jgi:hypothetical protein
LDDVPERVVTFPWCGSVECGGKVEEKDIKILGTPYPAEKHEGKCLVCGKRSELLAYAARSM